MVLFGLSCAVALGFKYQHENVEWWHSAEVCSQRSIHAAPSLQGYYTVPTTLTQWPCMLQELLGTNRNVRRLNYPKLNRPSICIWMSLHKCIIYAVAYRLCIIFTVSHKLVQTVTIIIGPLKINCLNIYLTSMTILPAFLQPSIFIHFCYYSNIE